MEGGDKIWSRLIGDSVLDIASIPGRPIIEIAEDRRILIENHFGVREYGRNKITVNVKFGSVDICGTCLELRQMTKEQLVITGKICSVTLNRKG